MSRSESAITPMGPTLSRRLTASALLALAWLAAGPLLAGSLEDLAKPQEGRSMRATSTEVDKNGDYAHGNGDNSRVPPGATKVVLDAKGPGIITHMWFTFLGPEPHPWAKDGSANHQEMLLRIYYDGRDRPGVEAPLGDFMANCFGRRTQVVSEPVVVEDADSYNCFWRMPFAKSIRVEIVNQSEKNVNLLYYNIDWIKRDSLPEDTPYFHAQYRQEYPVEQGKDYVIIETEGKTHSWNERQDDYASVAFWYQTGVPTFTARAPDAKARALPNLDVIFPAKSFIDASRHGEGEWRVQTNLDFYRDGQILFKPQAAENAWVEIPFTVREKEPRRLLLAVTRADDYGTYQAYLDGVKLGKPMDLFNKEGSPWEWHLLDFWPEPGEHTLRLECVGKHRDSAGYLLGVESIRLRERRPRVREWARDKDKDWRETPTLYD
ncbi:MAG: DUF2961 domain-containing protein [Planctomycetia bacterium]|nr:DUF2961 domain-containing protein [Planctomycetia bacterium]